jgi:hypothetical protein
LRVSKFFDLLNNLLINDSCYILKQKKIEMKRYENKVSKKNCKPKTKDKRNEIKNIVSQTRRNEIPKSKAIESNRNENIIPQSNWNKNTKAQKPKARGTKISYPKEIGMKISKYKVKETKKKVTNQEDIMY